MEKFKVCIDYVVLQDEELNEQDRILVQRAKDATYNSYSPYSHFSVGAAVRIANGEVYSGSNQENAAFPSGLCAERCVLFYAHAQYPEEVVETIAIAARHSDGRFAEGPISPCGACRQVLAETEYRNKKPLRILLYGTRGTLVFENVESLLPFMFTDDDM